MNKSRLHCGGFEFDSELIWTDWKPGIQYVKSIHVKNVSPRAMEIKYSLPETSQFQTKFPKPRKIAAGAQFDLPVTFTPITEQLYEDHVTFTIKNAETFVVRLRAVLPEYNLTVPKKLNFGSVAVNDAKSQIFAIRNMSTLETPFVVRIQSPFYVNQTEGYLTSMEKRMIEMTFQPKTPGIFSMEVRFDYGSINEKSTTMSLCGKAEYPKLALIADGMVGDEDCITERGEEKLINLRFPTTASGSTSKITVIIENSSKVDATARIAPVGSEVGFTGEQNFRVTSSQTIVRPGQRIEMPVYYQPKETGTEHVGYFKVITSEVFGEFLVKCTGKSNNVNVQTSVDHLLFDIVHVGQYDQRVFHIRNTCDLSTTYQLLVNTIDNDGVGDTGQDKQRVESYGATAFPLLEGAASGTIQGREEIRIVVGFLPPRAGHYYRRLVLLVTNQRTDHSPSSPELANLCAFEEYARVKHIMDRVNRLDQLFHYEFEGCANYKIQRDCSLCNPDSLRIPHCISIHCFGHTFAPSKQPFMPEFGLDRGSIHYPSMDRGETRFETFCVRNNSAYPLLVQQNKDVNCTAKKNRCQPMHLVVAPPSNLFHQLYKCHRNRTPFSFSNATHGPTILPVTVDVIQAAIELEHDGELYFPPAQIGAPVKRLFSVRNLTAFSTRCVLSIE
ncbi:unnamed protein product [Echinostoma caproni]|uniref:NTR domain-containing protein n=1 Tax=Echinostoma caproni TaxID=27848 RepID=A0A183AKF1_9TREM|nr:unnamed protein product [Echinostoma caproni]